MKNSQSPRNSVWLKLPVPACVLVVSILVCGTFWILPCRASVQTATVRARRLNVRPAPNTKHAPVAKLKKGMHVTVVAPDGRWLKIRFGRRSGYVFNDPRYLVVSAPAPVPETVRKARILKKSHALKTKIRQRRQKLSRIKFAEKDILASLNRLDRAVSRARTQIRNVQLKLRTLNAKIRNDRRRLAELKRQIRLGDQYAAGRLAALYKLQRLGKIEVLASADSIADLQFRRNALEQVLAYDRRMLQKLSKDRRSRTHLLGAHNRRLEQQQAYEIQKRAALAALSREKGRRSELLQQIRSRKNLEMAALVELQQAAKDLDNQLKAFDHRQPPAALASPAAAPPSAGLFKGLLKMPVEGKVISRFGVYRDRRLNIKNFRSGIDIRADRGEPIHCVGAGVVLFSSWFKGYGNMIIVNHGHHIYSVYAHLDERFKQAGEKVQAGEVIATVGDTGSLRGPMLYFELREHGKPVDPLRWIRAG